MADEIQKSYYAIIPANVRYDNNLPPNAKLLYGEITALCNEKGYCWATNQYFADLYNVSKISISKWIKALVLGGYINSKIFYKQGSKEIDNRCITIVNEPIKEKFNTPVKEKLKENNTKRINKDCLNNTFNKIENGQELENVQFEFSSRVKESIDLWLEYKKEKKQSYKPIGLRTLLKGFQKDIEEKGEQYVIDSISDSIKSNYSGIFPPRYENQGKPPKTESFANMKTKFDI